MPCYYDRQEQDKLQKDTTNTRPLVNEASRLTTMIRSLLRVISDDDKYIKGIWKLKQN